MTIKNKIEEAETLSRPKVFVGMSGGVDSSVSAALLKQATPNNFQKLFGRPTPEGFRGYDVTGVFIKVWTPDFLECTWKEDRLDAMRVCAKLGIPFFTVDLEKEYKKKVVDYMIFEYKAGRTPNPDVMCNKVIKFGAFFDWATEQNASFVATGHYARSALVESEKSKVHKVNSNKSAGRLYKPDGLYRLLTSLDTQKDQSYFLWNLTQKHLARTLFPVGGLEKTEVRKLAKKFGLPNALKKDSQGLCFLGKVDMKEFLGRFLPKQKGVVINEKGEVIGEHDGAKFFTLGERHCFRIKPQTHADITQKNADKNQKPYYVVARNTKKNTLTVAHRPIVTEVGEVRRDVKLKNVNWINSEGSFLKYLANDKNLKARIRYRAPLSNCKIFLEKNKSEAKVIFESPMEATVGQSLVIYKGDNLLGGGIIS